ncbi:hypothetical protein GA0116948_10741 [Chitinophaga costaii]|uniref:Uncharacterized protein n=1 Tax=Chitinophaga costaii TaxID=1335309 RepID=A0A1C4E227_9BACT|nr:hypothetical protein [Chitinophaga costaii]SCC37668.1 hypothetical protein GA0116948_10741 [Chitinophaga costaii]
MRKIVPLFTLAAGKIWLFAWYKNDQDARPTGDLITAVHTADTIRIGDTVELRPPATFSGQVQLLTV